MNDAFYIAATGMQAQQRQVEVLSNNVANMNTPAYKRGVVEFRDLVQAPTSGQPGDDPAPVVNSKLAGVLSSPAQRVMSAGDLRASGSNRDLAIRGDAFVEVQLPDGQSAYTRNITLTLNAEGLLATREGWVLRPAIHLGDMPDDLRIQPDGTVLGTDSRSGQVSEYGRLDLVSFAAPEGLEPMGHSLFKMTARSGAPLPVEAGEGTSRSFAQGYVEGSNVKLVDEMVGLMLAQRAYEMNVRAIQAADEMLGMANNLRR